jgi:hypothetical protein
MRIRSLSGRFIVQARSASHNLQKNGNTSDSVRISGPNDAYLDSENHFFGSQSSTRPVFKKMCSHEKELMNEVRHSCCQPDSKHPERSTARRRSKERLFITFEIILSQGILEKTDLIVSDNRQAHSPGFWRFVGIVMYCSC